MKRLLHNKKFRKNLSKWLFMYGATLMIFTSVVTYSKYFTKLASNDNARVAKFNISVNYLGENLNDINCKTNEICLTSDKVYAPGDTINYYFKVDTKELEVKTLVDVTVRLVDRNFKIVSVQVKNDKSSDDFVAVKNYGGITTRYDTDTIKSYSERVLATKGEVKIYKIGVKFDGYITNQGTNAAYDLYTKIDSPSEIIAIDYSAKQIND